MENLTDEELLNLATTNIDLMEKNLLVNKLVVVILLIEAILVLTNTITLISYLLFVVPCWCVYFFHDYKYRKALNLVENILDEFNKREII